MALLVFFISALIAIVSAIYAMFKMKFQYWAKRGVPCFEPKIPFGTLRRHGERRHLKDTMDETYREFKEKAPFAGMYFFVQPCPLIIDLDLVHHILVKDFSKFHDRGFFYNERDDPLSANLLSLEGQKWKALRSKLTPTFTSGKMKFMHPTILSVVKQFDQTLREVLKTEPEVEIKELLARFTTDVIGTCAFGIECNSLKDPNTEFRQVGKVVFEKPRNGLLGRVFITQFPGLAKKLGMKSTRDDVSDFFLRVVRETVEFREKNNVRRNDFMDILIELKNGTGTANETKDGLGKLSLEEIAAQAFIFFLAGFETSSTNMAYSLYELAKNQEIQDRARNEINEVLKKHNGELTYDAMTEMTYIDRINTESLRKYPPGIILVRAASSDYQVPNSDQIIEKGSRVFIPVYSIHHDPDIYSDPELFDPDRFLPDEMKKRHPMAFLGFGDGPRNCVGARFGQMQSRLGLVWLLKNFRFKLSDKTTEPLKYSIMNPILVPQDGIWLKMEVIE